MQEYYRRANNRALEIDAAEIRIIAMREWGIMYGEEKAQGRVPKGGNPNLSQPVQPPHRLPTLAELKIDGHFSANAQKLAALPDETIADRLDAWREQATTDRRVTVNILKDADKREQRAKREAHLGTMQAEANLKLPEKRYGVIYADPPWAFEVYSEKGMDRAPENHYPTMGLYDIKLLHVNDLAHSDCVLFMWATVPMLEAALAVMECWRFVYKSHFIWRKDKVGLGYWNRNVHELVLIGTRGNVPAPEPGTRELTVFDAPVGAHSEKPELFAQYIENWYPTLPKIELFARKARNGWDRWGLDAPAQEGSYILDKHA
jgi:N6-adenosine-specific RNA methylase IME4